MTSQQRVRLAAVSILAAVGASILAVIVATFWTAPGDNLAYWIAGIRLATGQAIYAPAEIAFEPFAYHYPPPLAQVLAPITLVLPALAYAVLYRAFMLLALWDIAGRRMLSLLALLAFIPAAVALRIENVEIFMALALVLGLRRWPWLFTIGALIKVSPGLGLVYLALRRRWRDLFIATAVGLVITVVSFVLAPDLWRAWLDAIAGRADMVGNSIVPVPYSVRAIAGFGLAIVAGLVGRRTGELLLVCAVTIANPGLSLQGFAVLIAAIPIWRAGPDGIGGAAEARAQSVANWRPVGG
ncbi:MAG TPA: glycosyltransferase family 87 protein [Candidatus Limnocylindria bacterium]|nr:glycosyltransferase family 87 protein [Candidatus Limnocylindria bacterium]